MTKKIIYYRSLGSELRERFGGKLYKIALDGGFTCPNRDGTLGVRGCSFCLAGSGGFSDATGQLLPEDPETVYQNAVQSAIEKGITRVRKKADGSGYIAYFQRYTSTYAPLEKLRKLYSAALYRPEIRALSVGTRPDCLPDETIALLSELNRKKPVWVELGLQTIHESTAARIRRGFSLPVFDDAVRRLKSAGLYTVVHMIIGLPGETPEMIRETAAYIGRSGADGIKLQLLHILRGTDLADEYLAEPFPLPSPEEYVELLRECVSALPAGMTVHRLTGDGAKKDLIAPLWSADKKRILQMISRELQPRAD